jgi:hypothetical protein
VKGKSWEAGTQQSGTYSARALSPYFGDVRRVYVAGAGAALAKFASGSLAPAAGGGASGVLGVRPGLELLSPTGWRGGWPAFGRWLHSPVVYPGVEDRRAGCVRLAALS